MERGIHDVVSDKAAQERGGQQFVPAPGLFETDSAPQTLRIHADEVAGTDFEPFYTARQQRIYGGHEQQDQSDQALGLRSAQLGPIQNPDIERMCPVIILGF